ncbi:hypothetical protein D3C87_1142660 [compost metagenome]
MPTSPVIGEIEVLPKTRLDNMVTPFNGWKADPQANNIQPFSALQLDVVMDVDAWIRSVCDCTVAFRHLSGREIFVVNP